MTGFLVTKYERASYLAHEGAGPVVTELVTAAVVVATLVNVLAGDVVRGEAVARVAVTQLPAS